MRHDRDFANVSGRCRCRNRCRSPASRPNSEPLRAKTEITGGSPKGPPAGLRGSEGAPGPGLASCADGRMTPSICAGGMPAGRSAIVGTGDGGTASRSALLAVTHRPGRAWSVQGERGARQGVRLSVGVVATAPRTARPCRFQVRSEMQVEHRIEHGSGGRLGPAGVIVLDTHVWLWWFNGDAPGTGRRQGCGASAMTRRQSPRVMGVQAIRNGLTWTSRRGVSVS